MTSTIICGLSDVLVPGPRGIDKPEPGAARAPGDVILERLVAEDLHDLYVGDLTVEAFCHRLLDRAGWPTDIEHVGTAIRQLFQKEIPGTADLLRPLGTQYRMVLLADHAREWIADIRQQHPAIMGFFHEAFFSFDHKQTKADPGTFRMVQGLLDADPAECLLIDSAPANIAAAAGAGIAGILFKNADQLAATLQAADIQPSPAN